MFKFVVSRTAKLVGRNVNSIFYTSTYREIFKELFEISKNETEAAIDLKNIGKKAAFESANRQETIMKMFPNDPIKILGYLDILWQTLFGAKLDEYIEYFSLIYAPFLYTLCLLLLLDNLLNINSNDIWDDLIYTTGKICIFFLMFSGIFVFSVRIWR